MSFINRLMSATKRNMLLIMIIPLVLSGVISATTYMELNFSMDFLILQILITFFLPFYMNMIISKLPPISLRFFFNLFILPVFASIFALVYFLIYNYVSDGDYDFNANTVNGFIETLITCVYVILVYFLLVRFNKSHCIDKDGLFKSMANMFKFNVVSFIKVCLLSLVLVLISYITNMFFSDKGEIAVYILNTIQYFSICIFVVACSVVEYKEVSARKGKI